MENLIMSWFGAAKNLSQITLLRKLSHDADTFQSNSHRHSGSSLADHDEKSAQKSDDPIDFNVDISCFDDGESYLNHLSDDDLHNIELYKITKWKDGNVYKCDVVGEL